MRGSNGNDREEAEKQYSDKVVASSETEAGRKFVVVTTQRTGSSWLMGRINSVPGAQGHLELFYNDIRREPARAGRDDYPRFFEIGNTFPGRTRMSRIFAYLDRFYSRPGAVGFKVMYSQLREYPEVLLYIAMRRLSVVHLMRCNDLDVVLSGELAKATRTFHATDDENGQETPAISLDAQEVVGRVRRLEKKRNVMRRLLRVLPAPVHEVAYEDLNADDDAFLNVCNYLGIPGDLEDRSQQRLSKRQRLPKEKAIANFDEVRNSLIRGGYGQLLN